MQSYPTLCKPIQMNPNHSKPIVNFYKFCSMNLSKLNPMNPNLSNLLKTYTNLNKPIVNFYKPCIINLSRPNLMNPNISKLLKTYPNIIKPIVNLYKPCIYVSSITSYLFFSDLKQLWKNYTYLNSYFMFTIHAKLNLFTNLLSCT